MENIKEKAYQLLLSNKIEGFNKSLKKNYFYIAPDKKHFHQWFWDSCFHIIVMSKFNPKYAIKELDTLLSVQLPDGFIPHIIFWKFRLRDYYWKWWKKEMHPLNKAFSAEVQPPVIAISLEKLYKKTKNKDILRTYLPKIEKFYSYLIENRDPDKDGLISIITPMESGMDFSPLYDIVFDNRNHNPEITQSEIYKMLKFYKFAEWDLEKIFSAEIFNVEDVSFNSIYALGLEALARLYDVVEDKDKSSLYRTKFERVKEKIIEKFWDEKDGIFYGLYHREGKEFKLRVKTISSLFPLCLDIHKDQVDSLIQHIQNPEEFWFRYPLPSVSRGESSFGPLTDTRYIWRGTTWINTNWFIAKGLLRHKRFNLYEVLRKKTLELVKKSGFWEFYDPFTGEPGKAMKDFSWSTLAIDL